MSAIGSHSSSFAGKVAAAHRQLRFILPTRRRSFLNLRRGEASEDDEFDDE